MIRLIKLVRITQILQMNLSLNIVLMWSQIIASFSSMELEALY